MTFANSFHYRVTRPLRRPRSRMRAGFPSLRWEEFDAYYCDAFNMGERRCLAFLGVRGADMTTLHARASYGGRKGRRALARLARGPMKPSAWRAQRDRHAILIHGRRTHLQAAHGSVLEAHAGTFAKLADSERSEK